MECGVRNSSDAASDKEVTEGVLSLMIDWGYENNVLVDLRCEWAKSKARADRWSEEVLLLVEEMRRVVDFLDWKAAWWLQQAARRTDAPPDITDGIAAYSAKQFDVMKALALSFVNRWYPILVRSGVHLDWLSDIPEGTNTEVDHGDSDLETEDDWDIEYNADD